MIKQENLFSLQLDTNIAPPWRLFWNFSILSPWSSLYYNYVKNWVIIKCNILYEHLQHFKIIV